MAVRLQYWKCRRNRCCWLITLLFFLLFSTVLLLRPLKDPQFSLMNAYSELISHSDTFTSSWTCTGQVRGRHCTVNNICIQPWRPIPFVVLRESTDPEQLYANIMAADDAADILWRPEIRYKLPQGASYVHNMTLVIHELYYPEHFSHWIFNGILPLYHIMRQHDLHWHNVVLYRPITPSLKTPLEFLEEFFAHPFDPAESSESGITATIRRLILGAFQHKETLCFPKAIIGYNNSCPFGYCANTISPHHAYAFQRIMLHLAEQPSLPKTLTQLAALERHIHDKLSYPPLINLSNTTQRIILLNRAVSRRVPNMNELHKALQIRFPSAIVESMQLDTPISTFEGIRRFKNVTILVAPHGNGLGNAVWMPRGSAVLSLTSRWSGGEWWFTEPLVLTGRRFWDWECQHDDCVATNDDLTQQCLRNEGLSLDVAHAGFQALQRESWESFWQAIHTSKLSVATDQQRWCRAWECNLKDTPRKVDVDQIVGLVQHILETLPRQETFQHLCETNECCKSSRCSNVLPFQRINSLL